MLLRYLIYRRSQKCKQLQHECCAVVHTRREFAAYRPNIKANGCSLLHRAARLFLREGSTLTTEMRVPSLSGSPGASRLVTLLPKCQQKCKTTTIRA
jgi:hypothetical protein